MECVFHCFFAMVIVRFVFLECVQFLLSLWYRESIILSNFELVVVCIYCHILF